MSQENHRHFVKTSLEQYRKIGHIECPAFDSEKIYFSKVGFNHLLWKGKEMRPVSEQKRRILLIESAIKILRNSDKFYEHRSHSRQNFKGILSTADFWSFKSKAGTSSITVVVRQTNNGKKHFMSVI